MSAITSEMGKNKICKMNVICNKSFFKNSFPKNQFNTYSIAQMIITPNNMPITKAIAQI